MSHFADECRKIFLQLGWPALLVDRIFQLLGTQIEEAHHKGLTPSQTVLATAELWRKFEEETVKCAGCQKVISKLDAFLYGAGESVERARKYHLCPVCAENPRESIGRAVQRRKLQGAVK